MQHELATLVGAVRRTIERHAMISTGDRVLVAVSGGSDSAGLALVLSRLCRRLGCELLLGHVHHGLRGPESDAGERAAASVAEVLELPFVRTDAHIAAGGNLEARARTARYAALHELAAASGCTRIATGHTRDDQAETFLLRLLRGAGADGLAGIRPRRDDGVVRPLLDCDRERIAAVVAARGLAVAADAMNEDPRFLRTRVRHELVPLLRDLNPRSVALAARAADAARSASAAERRWAATMLADAEGGLRLTTLRGLPAELRRTLLRAWLGRLAPADVTARLVADIDRLAEVGSAGTSIVLKSGWRVERRRDRLVAMGAAGPSDERFDPQPLNLGVPLDLPGGWRLCADLRTTAEPLPANLWTAICDLDKCGVLVVRTARPGERARPLGMRGHKRLADIFAARDVPRAERSSYPVVASGDDAGDLIWVPGVVRSVASSIDAATRRYAVLSAQRSHPGVTVAGGGTP